MTIFDIIQSLLFNKKRLDVSDSDAFVPYMVQRWISMYSPPLAQIVNQTTNRYYQGYVDNQMWYDTLFTVLPKVPFRKINYVKKEKVSKKKVEDNSESIAFLANVSNLSIREITDYIERDPSILDHVSDIEVFKKKR